MKISLRLTFLYIIALASMSLTFSESVSAAITISSASWSSGRLSVAGTSTGRQTVTISNAVTGQSIGRVTASRSGSWSLSTRLSSNSVPCSVRATSSVDGYTDSRVSGAPSNCVGKNAATLTLSDLTQTYTGKPLKPTVATTPSGLTVVWNGAPQTNAGTYQVTATINDPNYEGSTSGTFEIKKATATVGLSNLSQTYTGSALTPTATTAPANLTVDWTGAPQTNAGNYPVTAKINDPNYEGSTSGTFEIKKATAAVGLSNLSQTYTGSALTPTATTAPANLTVDWTGAPQTNAGNYPVTAKINDPNYEGSTSGTFEIKKATATVGLSNLSQTYTGSALTPTATTAPANLTVNWTGAPQTNAGNYPVTAKINDPNYEGSASDTFVINEANQTTPLVLGASPLTINFGGSSNLTVSGGNGNGTITYSATHSVNNQTCNVAINQADTAKAVLTATAAGTCTVTATKAADTNYNQAGSNRVIVTVKDQAGTTPVSINSTSTDSLAPVEGSVSELPSSPVGINGTHSILAVNDLGMHCVDNDTRVVNILPPFQVLLGQVVQKGSKPVLNPTGVELFYSSTSNAKDPILGKTNVLNGLRTDGTTFKTNFWWNVEHGGYDAFYPAGLTLSTSGLMGPDKGLPVPNTEKLYLEGQGLEISQQLSPGVAAAYSANDPQKMNERYTNKPFFKDFAFGYVADKVNWHEAAGIPMAPFDDSGRQNPYPLVRVQAKPSGSNTALASVDTVLPVSSESSCVNCHASTQDVAESGAGRRTLIPVTELVNAGLPVASSTDDPDQSLPKSVKLEYGTDINILRLHDLKHGKAYVKATGPDGKNFEPAVCDIDKDNPKGNDNCLTYQALVTEKPVVCQTCHYTPALDLLQVGPKNENGRNQLVNKTNSNVMHSHHGSLRDENGNPLFPLIPQALQSATDGSITNQPVRAAALEENCYQCHPGKDTKCLRGAMFNGGMLCSDCHGDMTQVGNDFSHNVSKENPGPEAFDLHGNFYTDASQPRVPWANEPGCGSCHTGDANSNFATKSGVLKNLKDHNGVTDNIRLRQAFLTGDPKATPIVPTNKRFAEPVVPATSAATLKPNPGAGNPQLFRVSTGHSGVMCEGCHGPTHAEWPVADNNANDNQTAIQLQGHAGFISECTACHTSGSLSASTQNGPHGMHVVNDSRFWSESHKDMAKSENRKAGGGTCGSCHGSDHLGTVLSRVPVDRTFRVEGTNRTVKAGQPVACNLCHSVSKSFGN